MQSQKRILTLLLLISGASLLPFASTSTEVNVPHSTDLISPVDWPISLVSKEAAIKLTPIGTYRGGMYSGITPTQARYDPETRRVFVGSGDRHAIDVLDISDPTNPYKIYDIDLSPYGIEPNGLAIHHGVIGVTVKVSPGVENVVFFNVSGKLLAGPISSMNRASKIEFTPNGKQAIVTISGGLDPTNHYYSDEAAVAILDLGNVNWGACRQGSPKCKFSPSVTIVDFRDFNNKRDELIAAGVRLLDPTATIAQNLETSGMGISEDSKFAFISAPEANSIIVVDLKNHQVTKLLPLGYKDMNLPGNGGFDASDKDGKINIRNWPVRALYQPKGIWPMGGGNDILIVTANEGNLRDKKNPIFQEEIRVSDITLDPVAFPNATFLKDKENLGRLGVSAVSGYYIKEDGSLVYNALYMGGARSMSIFSGIDGHLLSDTSAELESTTAEAVPAYFNSPSTENNFDNRSPKKGPEFENITVGLIGDRRYAFGIAERIGGVWIYDITDPVKPVLQQYINNRNFNYQPASVCGSQRTPNLPDWPDCYKAGDLEPEGVCFISAEDSPTGQPLLVVNHEASDSTTLYRIEHLPPAR